MSGSPILKNRQATGLTNSEEQALKRKDAVPFLLEDKMRECGALFQAKENFTSHVIQYGMMITGQNMRSAEDAAETVIRVMRSIA